MDKEVEIIVRIVSDKPRMGNFYLEGMMGRGI